MPARRIRRSTWRKRESTCGRRYRDIEEVGGLRLQGRSVRNVLLFCETAAVLSPKVALRHRGAPRCQELRRGDKLRLLKQH